MQLKDSVIAVADASYLAWPVAPEAPAELVVRRTGDKVELQWKGYGSSAGFEIQRSNDWGNWQKILQVKPDVSTYSERLHPGHHITYRVRAFNQEVPSAWSNPAWIEENP